MYNRILQLQTLLKCKTSQKKKNVQLKKLKLTTDLNLTFPVDKHEDTYYIVAVGTVITSHCAI